MREKVGKLIIRDIFSKSKGHNFGKNQWIETELKLDLYRGMSKQCTKYQIKICKQWEKSAKNVKSLNAFKGRACNSSKNCWRTAIFDIIDI
jgi:hypothetical protein